ncbi:MAG: undecaprenyl-diphosphate phosphatase [Desulfurococcales archaeon]|nr:undecaprenyl-diphosphate phosphatase [Desulfurococcales archaeon]
MVEALLLGVLQGVLEWLPVSSSGQLSLILAGLLHLDPGAAYRLSIASHLGTSLSGAVVVRDEVIDAVKLGPSLRVALIPLLAGAPIALLVDKYIGSLQGDVFNLLIGALLIVTAALTLASGGLQGGRRARDLRAHELALVGVVQGLAALPGLSRSGATIAALLLLKLEPLEAVRASFLMGTAATGAMAAYTLIMGVQAPAAALAAMTLASLVAGIASATLMIALARKYNDKIAVFTLIIAALAIISAAPALKP